MRKGVHIWYYVFEADVVLALGVTACREEMAVGRLGLQKKHVRSTRVDRGFGDARNFAVAFTDDSNLVALIARTSRRLDGGGGDLVERVSKHRARGAEPNRRHVEPRAPDEELTPATANDQRADFQLNIAASTRVKWSSAREGSGWRAIPMILWVGAPFSTRKRAAPESPPLENMGVPKPCE